MTRRLLSLSVCFVVTFDFSLLRLYYAGNLVVLGVVFCYLFFAMGNPIPPDWRGNCIGCEASGGIADCIPPFSFDPGFCFTEDWTWWLWTYCDKWSFVEILLDDFEITCVYQSEALDCYQAGSIVHIAYRWVCVFTLQGWYLDPIEAIESDQLANVYALSPLPDGKSEPFESATSNLEIHRLANWRDGTNILILHEKAGYSP